MPTSKEPQSLTYKDSGVDTAAGDQLADRLRQLCRRTHSTRVLEAPVAHGGGDTGMFRLDFPEKLFARNYKDPVLISSAAGVGTKIKFAADLKKFDTIGQDLVALNVNDLIVQGAEPLFFLDHLSIRALDADVTTQIVQGISDGCMEAGCALLGGETAEMPVLAAGELDLSGFAVGVAERSKLFTPEDVEPGDSIIGLASSGLHANGYSLVRRVIEKSGGGAGLNDFIPDLNGTLADELLRPTRIYVKTVQKILARYKVKKIVKGMAHVTSGGIAGCLPRMLPAGLSARLKRDAWMPAPIFHWLQKSGPVDLDEMFRVFNMGIGFMLIVRPTFTKPIMSALRALREKPCFLGKIRKVEGAAGEGAVPQVEWS